MSIPQKLMNSRLYRKSGATGDTLGEAIDINQGTAADYAAIDKALARRAGATGTGGPGTIAGGATGGGFAAQVTGGATGPAAARAVQTARKSRGGNVNTGAIQSNAGSGISGLLAALLQGGTPPPLYKYPYNSYTGY